MTTIFYTNRDGVTMTQATIYIPLVTKDAARARGLNLSAVAAQAIAAAVQDDEYGNS